LLSWKNNLKINLFIFLIFFKLTNVNKNRMKDSVIFFLVH
jgi:hypothetical protein